VWCRYSCEGVESGDGLGKNYGSEVIVKGLI